MNLEELAGRVIVAATLDMTYIEHWCARHGTTQRLHDALAAIPPM